MMYEQSVGAMAGRVTCRERKLGNPTYTYAEHGLLQIGVVSWISETSWQNRKRLKQALVLDSKEYRENGRRKKLPALVVPAEQLIKKATSGREKQKTTERKTSSFWKAKSTERTEANKFQVLVVPTEHLIKKARGDREKQKTTEKKGSRSGKQRVHRDPKAEKFLRKN